MTAGKTTFVLEADEAKVVSAYLKVADAQKQNIDHLRQMNREGQQTTKAMETGFRSVASAIGTLSLPAALATGVRNIVQELERAKNLKKEMSETALTVEQLSLKLAQLRGDVTKGGVGAVTKDIADISKQAAVSLEVASKSLFYAESAMGAGTARAKSAALEISRFAGPAGLTPEETMLIPKLFDIMKANTGARQRQVLNQLNAATRASIAETGEFISPFMKPLVSDIQRGFTLPQSLARMVAAVQVTGSVEEAGTISATALDIAAGRTEEALKYYRSQARRRGLDYGKMMDPERYEFARRLYKEAEAGGAGAMDVLKTKVGAKGFRAIRAIFGETGERKYFEVLPQIEEALGSTMVEKMSQQYLELMTAEAAQQMTRMQIGGTRIGKMKRPEIVFEDMVTEILKQSKAQVRGLGEYVGLAMIPEAMERYAVARTLIEENLHAGLKYMPKGTPQYRELLDLFEERNKPSFRLAPEFIRRTYEATEGFTLPEKYGWAYGPPSERQLGGGKIYETMGRGMETYFNVPATEEHTKAIKDNTEALNRLADKVTMPAGSGSGMVD